ncbi:MAG: ABC transporter substrate-binding protein [Planctomycetota bacterium]
MSHSRARSILPALLGMLAFWSCGAGEEVARAEGSEPTAADVGDSLRIAIQGDPDGWLAVVQNTATAQMIGSMMMPSLTDSDFRDGVLLYEPYLAKSWEFSDNDTKLTFHLRDDITWPDGKPVTARDVKFTMDLVWDPKVASPRKTYLDTMDEKEPVTVLDDWTVRFNFKWAYNKTTMIAHASSVEVHPEHMLADADRSALRRHRLHKKEAFGHGPYRLQSWKPDESLTLVRNPDCKIEDLPYLERLVFKIIPEYQTRLQALKNGQVDIMEALQEKDIEDVAGWPHVNVYTKGYRFMDYVAWNMKHPLFRDRDVRRALTMAIDIQRMIDALLTFGGKVYGTQAYATITPELEAYRRENRKFLPFDPERAKQIMAEKGWKPGSDGVLVKDGRRFEFKLATNSGNPRRADAVVMIEQDLKKIGIKANIEKYEGVTFFDNLRKKDFEAALAGWSAGLFVDPSNIWGSPTEEDKKPFNHCSYSNPRVDALIEKGLRTSDFEEERQCWLEMQDIIYEDQPYTFLFWRSESFACHKRVRGIVPNILTTYFKIERWWVPKSEHKFRF